jgi:hypothetical protein
MKDHPSLRVEDGEVLVFRLFDVADAVDLHRADEAAAAPSSRLRLENLPSATALQFPRPPLQLDLGARSLPLASGARPARASAKVFDYGVVSICYRLAIAPGTEVAELVPLAEQLFVEPAPAVDAEARREAEAIAAALHDKKIASAPSLDWGVNASRSQLDLSLHLPVEHFKAFKPILDEMMKKGGPEALFAPGRKAERE